MNKQGVVVARLDPFGSNRKGPKRTDGKVVKLLSSSFHCFMFESALVYYVVVARLGKLEKLVVLKSRNWSH